MRVTRFRFAAALEWVLAAGCVAIVAAAGGFLAAQIQTFKGVTPVLAGGPPAPEPPAGLPYRAVSVPMLLLNGGAEIHLGERASGVQDKVSRTWEVGSETIERGEFGERVTQAYDDGARRFVLVLEPTSADADPRLAGIYLQPR